MQDFTAYLQSCEYIDFHDIEVAKQARMLSAGATSEQEIVERCFLFVRDAISHSVDVSAQQVSCLASEVLRYGTGFCYAKSHLLAALLRANGIPTGLCYQRLSIHGGGAPYCLHGLNAVFLQKYGWYRIDARGNKLGITTNFCPPIEALAFTIQDKNECDLPEIWSSPLLCVTRVLQRYTEVRQICANLPDIPLAF